MRISTTNSFNMSEKVVVTVNEGKIRGFKTKSAYSGSEYYSFLGIPYGQPTGGQARFKDPVKVKPWNKILDATVEKEGCVQFSILQKMRICGTEDCLYNNVYTPHLPSKGDALKAVVVNIHPGGFYHGSPDPSHYGSPEFFMHRDIVYVGVGYRLSILGGLNLGLEECSGNQGLKDVILSLQWIRDNISSFGGDPGNVTIMGSSSGSAIVHFLLLSPLTKGLYHKAILMGIYVFNPVLIQPIENITSAYNLALELGYQGEKDNRKKLLMFYKKISMYQLIALKPEEITSSKFFPVFPSSPFLPTYEQGDKSVLPAKPNELIPSTNRVPMMVGFCEREGVMGLLRPRQKALQEHIYKVLRQNQIGWGRDLSDDDLNHIQKQIESFYLDGHSIEDASVSTKCDILTDAALSDLYDSLINVISADLPNSVYLYKFQYGGKLCTMRSRIEPLLENPIDGAFHAADFAYLNYVSARAGRNMELITQKDREIIDTFTNLITTFAKTGNPNYDGLGVHWKPTKVDNPNYLNIDETLEARDELLNGKRMKFWHRLKSQYKK